MKRWLKRAWRKIFPKPQETRIVITEKPVQPIQNDNVRTLPQCRTNKKGIALIKEKEGWFPDPYRCPANVITIAWGTTYYPDGSKVKMSDPSCTKEQGEKWLLSELDEKEEAITRFIKNHGVTLNDNQFSALVSFAYNLGFGYVTNKTSTMSRALMSGDMEACANAFMLYTKARVGRFRRLKTLRGLVIRRGQERDLFISRV